MRTASVAVATSPQPVARRFSPATPGTLPHIVLDFNIQNWQSVAMLSQTTEYALRLVVQLASEGDRPVTIPELARATKIPSGYLAKVLRQLSRAGLVHSQRGPNGGSVLLRPPEELTVLDVVQA